MMKAIIIGGSGHWNIAAQAAEKHAISIIGVAPSRQSEDISGITSSIDARVYGDWRELADAANADIAIVNPWFCDAAGISKECLERGMHVYSEKPLATTHKDIDALESTWQDSGRALGGMFNYRFYPWFLAMEEAVKAGEIGEARQAHGQKSYRLGTRADFYKKRELMGGLIPWVAIHAMDWVTAFLGRCEWVSAAHSARENRGNGDMEVTSATLMGMGSGKIGTVTADFLRPAGSARHDDDRLRITGTRGMIEAIDGEVYLENESSKRKLTLPAIRNSLIEFINAIESGSAASYANDAIHATRTALAARDSADSCGARMTVE